MGWQQVDIVLAGKGYRWRASGATSVLRCAYRLMVSAGFDGKRRFHVLAMGRPGVCCRPAIVRQKVTQTGVRA
jgi:hypothetical protein